VAPSGQEDPDEEDLDERSPEAAARSYEAGRRSARRFMIACFAAVIAFDLVIAWLVAGWIVAVSLATPQVLGMVMIFRQPRRPNPYKHPEGRKDAAG
jgi:Flp pilus assembly protein TadB